MSRTLTNGHTNGSANHIGSAAPGVTVYTLPAWENRETSLVFFEILYATVMNEDPDGILDDESGIDAYARRLGVPGRYKQTQA
jgi:hypothetical protein